MKIQLATFVLEISPLDTATVVFDPERAEVRIHRGRESQIIENRPRKCGGPAYKPCLSHAADVFRLAFQQPAKSEQEKQRRETVKKKPLKIHRS